jgi:hypothetical protein
MSLDVPISTLLPKEVRDALIEASKVDPKMPPGLSLARTMKVEAAACRAAFIYPVLFKKGA